ncbi:T-box transcription factor tbx21 [Mortierella sp. GBA30]|nr:T-box transcription factor tbx21 [Mortierella sp. GBA30]
MRVSDGSPAPIFKQDYAHKEIGASTGYFDLRHVNPGQNASGSRSDLAHTSLWSGALMETFDSETPVQRLTNSYHSMQSEQIESVESNVLDRRMTRASTRAVVARHQGECANSSKRSSFKSINTPDKVASTIQKSPISSPTSKSVANGDQAPSLLLVDAELWSKFHKQETEMIITKAGRCLFPCLRFKAVGLNPAATYTIYLDFELLDKRRFRFEEGHWKATEKHSRLEHDSTRKITSALSKESYTHPDMRQTGDHWMNGIISFDKAKLSNSREPISASFGKVLCRKRGVSNNNSNHIFHLSSFHKYRPRVQLVQRAPESNAIVSSTMYTFDLATFMAVTHYQNCKVNDLKKGHNPHAKGFRDKIGNSTPLIEDIEWKQSRATPSAAKVKRQRRPCIDEEANSESDTEESETDQRGKGDHTVACTKHMAMQGDSDGSAGESSETVVNPSCRLDKKNKTMVTISLTKNNLEAASNHNRTAQVECCKGITSCVSVVTSRSRSNTLSIGYPRSLRTPSKASKRGTISPAFGRSATRNRGQEMHSGRAQSGMQTSDKPIEHTPVSRTLFVYENGRPIGNTSNITPEQGSLSGPVLAESALTDPVIPTLSWYQQFSFWDQPFQQHCQQPNHASGLATPAQSAIESVPSLLLPFDADQVSNYAMLHESAVQPTSPQELSQSQQLLSEPFDELMGNMVQEDLALEEMNRIPASEHDTSLIRTTPTMACSRDEQTGGYNQMEWNTNTNTSQQTCTDPRLLFTTILESKTVMSTSSSISAFTHSKSAGNAHLELALQENYRLKAFIRERYGPEAEAEANAVMAMGRRQ